MSTVELQHYLIGEDLVALRRKIGWSQQALAEYLRLSNASHLSQIENGHRWITCAEEVLLQQLEEAFERGELQSGVDPDDFHPDPEAMSTGDLCREMEDLLGSPDMQRLHETSTPQIYITFAQSFRDARVEAESLSNPDHVTFGPYLDVKLAEGVMHVTAPETEASPLCKSFCLATLEGAGWNVRAGMEKATPIYTLVRFHTFRRCGKRCERRSNEPSRDS